jgi:hypothetical protein
MNTSVVLSMRHINLNNCHDEITIFQLWMCEGEVLACSGGGGIGALWVPQHLDGGLELSEGLECVLLVSLLVLVCLVSLKIRKGYRCLRLVTIGTCVNTIKYRLILPSFQSDELQPLFKCTTSYSLFCTCLTSLRLQVHMTK